MILAFSVAPSGAAPGREERLDGSVSDAVAEAVKVVRASGLPHRTSSMFTEIEGEWDEVFEVVKRATEAVLPFGSRVSLVMKADIRRGGSGLGWDAKRSRPEARAATAAQGELDGKLERLERAIEASGE
ncbi:MAG: thiamine-binding protein [Leucobacter sp.]